MMEKEKKEKENKYAIILNYFLIEIKFKYLRKKFSL